MFSLINYLNEGILNEKLSSSILLDKILNDPSETFKYYIAKDPSYHENERKNIYQRLEDLIRKYNDLHRALPYSWRTTIDMPKNDISIHINNHENGRNFSYKLHIPATDEGMIKLNNMLTDILEKITGILKNLFKKPHLGVLEDILYKNIDWANINDSNFTKFTFFDLKLMIKNNKTRYEGIFKDSENYIFYFKENGEFLGLSNDALIKFYSISISGIPSRTGGNLSSAYQKNIDIKLELNNRVKKLLDPYLEEYRYCLNMILTSGEELKFISTRYVDEVKNLINDLIYTHSYKDKFINTNSDITAKSSNVRKYLGFGESKNDYILVYTGDKDIKGLFNYETKHLTNLRKLNYEGSATLGKYKWMKKLDGTYVKYANQLLIFYEFGYKVVSNDFYRKSTDDICNSLARNNFEKYKAEVSKIQAIKKSVTYKKSLDELIEKLDPYFLKKYEANNKIFELMTTDIAKAKELKYAFATYMAFLNDIIKSFSKIKLYQEKLNKRSLKVISNSWERNSLVNDIESLNGYIQKEIDDINKNKLPMILDLYKEISDFIEKN